MATPTRARSRPTAERAGFLGIPTLGYAAHSATVPLVPFSFERRNPLPTDVHLEILYCGVCHSDLHTVRSEWGGTVYPVVPGHEIVGRVLAVGSQVSDFKPGDLAAVGCMVDSCRHCPDCAAGEEQFCQNELVFTYNSRDPHTGGTTYGGYSNQIVVDQQFVLRFPETLDPAAGSPLLCAGITTYSPLRHWEVGPGQRVGVVGLGGLGHMAVKFAHAFGAEVVLFTTSPGKTEDAKRLGADDVVLSRNAGELKRHVLSFDFILDTVAVPHDLDAYLNLLKRDGTLCLVGVPEKPHPSPSVGQLIFKRRSLAGSLIGGIRETQEMLDFCGAHNIVSDIELIPIHGINEAYERMLRSDVKYRFVLDLATIDSPGGEERAA
ncbi:MAG TPA: NAD(P)-dependent alcohol dehydrogenase [Gemmatimonadales bacterium]|nr:NAD(P)-dependent alcohol dehydrogenase [Gemmatimonadales bacterium]